MATGNTTERTARAPFMLNGNPVRAGQVVPLTRAQIDKLDRAGCVYADDDLNSEVPKADLNTARPGEGENLEVLDQADKDEVAGNAAHTGQVDTGATAGAVDPLATSLGTQAGAAKPAPAVKTKA